MFDLSIREHVTMDWSQCLLEPPIEQSTPPDQIVWPLTLCFKHLAYEAYPDDDDDDVPWYEFAVPLATVMTFSPFVLLTRAHVENAISTATWHNLAIDNDQLRFVPWRQHVLNVCVRGPEIGPFF